MSTDENKIFILSTFEEKKENYLVYNVLCRVFKLFYIGF